MRREGRKVGGKGREGWNEKREGKEDALISIEGRWEGRREI